MNQDEKIKDKGWFKINKEKNDFFTLLVAVIAVILSQFPPMYTFFGSYEIQSEQINSIHLEPNPENGISLRYQAKYVNEGSRKGIIHDIHLLLFDENDDIVDKFHADEIKIDATYQSVITEWETFKPIILNENEVKSKEIRFIKSQFSNFWKGSLSDLRYQTEMERNEWCEENQLACDSYEGPYYSPSKGIVDLYTEMVSQEYHWLKSGDFTIAIISLLGETKSEDFLCDAYSLNFASQNINTLLLQIERTSLLDFIMLEDEVQSMPINEILCNDTIFDKSKEALSLRF